MARRSPRPPSSHEPPAGRRRSKRALAVVAALVVLVGTPAAVVVVASSKDATARPEAVKAASSDPLHPAAPFLAGAGDGTTPNGIGCANTPQRRLRARAHLDVFADGARVQVPARIGILATCAYWVHTTDDSGIVQITSPVVRSFTLGDLFDIWGAPLTSRQVLGFRLSSDEKVRTFVGGKRVSGDPRDVRLTDRREIALVIGEAPSHVPGSFAFPSGR